MRSAPYSRYAAVYDQIGQRVFGERIAIAILGWLRQRDVKPGRIVDLACGTGAATLILAQTGAQTIGVDRSPEMLTIARRTADGARLSIDWQQQDIRDFSMSINFDLSTSFFDSMNYLT